MKLFQIVKSDAYKIFLIIIYWGFFLFMGSPAIGSTSLKQAYRVDPFVLEVRSSETEHFIYRALAGRKNKKNFLIIEKLSRSEENGKIIESWDVADLPGGSEVKFDAGWGIYDLEWDAGGLRFKNQITSGSLITSKACSVSIYDKKRSVICR